MFFIFIFGPFPEELGWRGYALDSLQERINPLFSSLVLGLIWAIWHTPLFLMRGTYQYDLGFGSVDFWLFMLFATLSSIFFTWIYNNNQRSILSASLLHFVINLTGNVFVESLSTRTLRLILLLSLAVLLIFMTRKQSLLGFPGQVGSLKRSSFQT
jgi:membrane protease YdiL (CAAX protease family)